MKNFNYFMLGKIVKSLQPFLPSCKATVESSVLILYKIPSYRISLLLINVMWLPKYGTAIFFSKPLFSFGGRVVWVTVGVHHYEKLKIKTENSVFIIDWSNELDMW